MSYEDVFAARGDAYAHAMQRWPHARREEFEHAVERAAPRPGEVLADVPAGGGYLERHLPAGVTYRGCEPCASFGGHAVGDDARLLPLPLPSASVDVAVSIAGVHHLADKQPLYAELHRVLAPAGRLVLADVHADAAVARFLDGFVGMHNSTGHAGVYLDDTTPRVLAAAGFEIAGVERVRYAWWFDDRAAMGAFCRLLFDIRGRDVDAVAAAVERELGVREAAGAVGMNWELCFICARRG